jgi:hypothetical protein
MSPCLPLVFCFIKEIKMKDYTVHLNLKIYFKVFITIYFEILVYYVIYSLNFLFSVEETPPLWSHLVLQRARC